MLFVKDVHIFMKIDVVLNTSILSKSTGQIGIGYFVILFQKISAKKSHN